MLIILGATGGLGKGLVDYIESQPALKTKFGNKIITTNRNDIDIEDESSVSSFFKTLSEKLNESEPIYIINTIGVSLNNFFHKMDLSQFEKTIKVNLVGSFLLLKYLQPLIKNRPGSSIVFLSSIVGALGVPGTIAYSASKSGLNGLIRTGAKELARYQVTLNAIQLGYFNKGMIEQLNAEQVSEVIKQIPLNRLGGIEDLYSACEFSLTNSFLTGSVINLNGGML